MQIDAAIGADAAEISGALSMNSKLTTDIQNLTSAIDAVNTDVSSVTEDVQTVSKKSNRIFLMEHHLSYDPNSHLKIKAKGGVSPSTR